MERLGMLFGARKKDVGEAVSSEERIRVNPQTAQRIAGNLRSLMELSERHAEIRARRAELGAGEVRFQPPALVPPERKRASRVA
jgi:hypothetical protein